MMIRTALTIRGQAAKRLQMTMMLVMVIVVVALIVAASDSFDRKRSFDFAHLMDPFPQITPTFWLLGFVSFSRF